ncbi:YciI family protein [Stenotrophomonas sp.]|uniref:YciI family protein n=1 Tax=Stenotrophomonas sp. TaxID=69392 RepID=UPI002D33E505|nr:YciI family protein [Stenotrophomonas sp.]HYQ23697.1 YciI family protein [Stenotrophomonas sp.]
MQQYLLIIYIEPALLQALPSEEFNRLMRDCLAHADQLQAEGTLLIAQKLQPVDTAQTLRVRDGQSRVLDGPFAETRELLAGFNLIRARDRDDAMRIARQFPWARFGSIEVRPLEDMDAERERCGAPAAAMAAAAP